MDFVTQDVVACDVADGFYGEGFVVEGDFVAFYYFLDGGADVVDPRVDTSFLVACSISQQRLC